MKTNTMDEMVAAVWVHAKANYNEGGWDMVVECYDDDDVRETIKVYEATTVDAAIAAQKEVCDVWHGRRLAARSEFGDF